MKYYIHFGKLYAMKENSQGACLCYLKKPMYSLNKVIVSSDGNVITKTEVIQMNRSKRLENRRYLLKDAEDHVRAEGQLRYAEGADQWPVCHAPRVDSVLLRMGDSKYVLKMLNSQNFTMTDMDGNRVMGIIHDGVNGGWLVNDNGTFNSCDIMGVFIFCRYLDKENEFMVV